MRVSRVFLRRYKSFNVSFGNYPDRRADLFLSGPGIVGLAFTPSRALVVATTNALYRVDVGIKGRPLL